MVRTTSSPGMVGKSSFCVADCGRRREGGFGQEGTGAVYPLAGYGLLPRVAQVLYSLVFYPGKTLLPLDLSPLYPLHGFTWNLAVAVAFERRFGVVAQCWLLLG